MGGQWNGKYLGNRTNTNDEDEQDNDIIMGPFHFMFDPPQSNYTLSKDIRILDPQGNKQANARPPVVLADGSFDLVMDFLNFGGSNEILLDVELVFLPLQKAKDDYEVAKAEAQKKYDAEKQRLFKKSFMENVRQRIKDASNIKSRPS